MILGAAALGTVPLGGLLAGYPAILATLSAALSGFDLSATAAQSGDGSFSGSSAASLSTTAGVVVSVDLGSVFSGLGLSASASTEYISSLALSLDPIQASILAVPAIDANGAFSTSGSLLDSAALCLIASAASAALSNHQISSSGSNSISATAALEIGIFEGDLDGVPIIFADVEFTRADSTVTSLAEEPEAPRQYLVSGWRTNVKNAFKRARIRGKAGTEVILRWTEWPDGEPEVDPTTGERLATDDTAPVQRSCTTKAWVHYVTQSTSTIRTNSEVETGDCIAEFTAPLVRITDSGGTSLDVGSVVNEWDFNAANRLAEKTSLAPAECDSIEIESLKSLVFEIDGDRWAQAKIGEELRKSWDAIVSSVKISRSILLRKV